jgi:protocatechuate 3,4-dioxygenase beta subunit
VSAIPLARVEGDEATLRGMDVPHAHPDYRSTILRAPDRPFLLLPPSLADRSGPVFGHGTVGEYENDLTRQHAGEPLGERINVSGRVLDRAGRPVRSALIEIWQANSAGRYIHGVDRHPAPLDPNFTGAGRCLTDDEGRYRFVTIRPGAYPWGNHPNAWRPAHIHLSLFGRAFTDRLVTQMYFPGDPLFEYDPIFRAVRDPSARDRLISRFDLETTEPEWALGYRFDVVLGGSAATPIEDP